MRPSSTPPWLLLLASAILAVGFCFAGCRQPATPPDASATSCVNPPVTLRQTFDCLRAWRAQGSYEAVHSYVDPAASEDLIDLLIVVDEIMAANAGAQQAIRRVCPQLDTRQCDLSYLEQYMGFFSKDVTYIRDVQKGDEAIVTAQVADHMPLVELRFRRQRGPRQSERWLYVPGETMPELVPLLRDVARALDQVTLVLSASKGMGPQEVRHEFEVRLRPRLKRIAAAATQASEH